MEDNKEPKEEKEIKKNKEPAEEPEHIAKPKRKKKLFLYVLLGVCIAAIIATAVGLGLEIYASKSGDVYYTELSDDIERRPPPTAIPLSVPPSLSPSDEVSPPEPVVTEAPIAAEAPWVPYVDFQALGERFPGIVGWIKLDGTKLDYPVMQTTDNSHYLSYLPDGTKNRSGSVFLDYRSSPDFSDRDSAIYGHESKSGEMFATLKSYRQQAFYDANPIIHFYTAEHDYDLVVFAGYLVDSGVETPQLTFKDDESFDSYIAKIKSRSFFKSDVEVSASDKLISLCTCAYDFTNARLVIVGKLVETDGTNP